MDKIDVVNQVTDLILEDRGGIRKNIRHMVYRLYIQFDIINRKQGWVVEYIKRVDPMFGIEKQKMELTPFGEKVFLFMQNKNIKYVLELSKQINVPRKTLEDSMHDFKKNHVRAEKIITQKIKEKYGVNL